MGRRAGGRKGDAAALLLRSCWRELAEERFEVFAELTARLRETGSPEHWVGSSSPGICIWFTAFRYSGVHFNCDIIVD